MFERKLRSATEMRKEFKRIQQKNRVVEAIEEAAAKNRRKCEIEGWLSEELKKELRELDYTITEFTYGYTCYTAIEW